MKQPLVVGQIFLALLIIATPVVAQTMEFSCPTPGTKIQFNNGSSIIIDSQEGMFCKITGALTKRTFNNYAMMHLFSEEDKKRPEMMKYIDPVRVEKIWPLAIGKSHKGQVDFQTGTYWLEYTVVAFESIETPMGSQKVFRVALKETSSNGYRADATWWISPTLKYLLKYEFNDNRGGNSKFWVTTILPP